MLVVTVTTFANDRSKTVIITDQRRHGGHGNSGGNIVLAAAAGLFTGVAIANARNLPAPCYDTGRYSEPAFAPIVYRAPSFGEINGLARELAQARAEFDRANDIANEQENRARAARDDADRIRVRLRNLEQAQESLSAARNSR